MVRLGTFGRWALTAALASGGGLVWAQQPAGGCPQGKDTQTKDAQGNWVPDLRCAQAAAPSTAQKFPYPGEVQAPATPTPDAGQGTPAAPAAKRFPYPGESDAPSPATQPGTPGAATPAPSGPPLQDAGSSGSSSSSSASSSSSSSSSSTLPPDDPSAAAADANDPAAVPRSKRRKVPAVPRQSPSEREQEDVQVAGFYQNDGNFRGAYSRAKDAVTLDGDDAAAHLALGEAARKLGLLDEAEKAYKRCLELDPVPKQRKVAEKALKEMTGGS